MTNVNCSNCRIQTSHTLTREQIPDLLRFEIIRVTERKYQGAFILSKNSIPISFPTDGIKVPGSNKKYRVIGTSSQRLTSLWSLDYNNSYRKELVSDRWFKILYWKSWPSWKKWSVCCSDNPNGWTPTGLVNLRGLQVSVIAFEPGPDVKHS